jgi:16S rRNA (cytosine1402-N4)-methyltransferase
MKTKTLQKVKHFPVLLKEFLHFFEKDSISIFFDGTVGAAGHAAALLEAHPEIDIYIGCDRDKAALKIANENLKPWMKKVRLIHENYANIGDILDEMNIEKVDGIFLDIGVSSMQLDTEERGFSFRFDAPLDMRMDKSKGITAREVVNKLSEKELYNIFKEYGEERRARAAAKKIVNDRKRKKINTTFDLLEVLQPVLGRRKRIHPATKVFQALRIYVNDELGALKKALSCAADRLQEDKKIGVISFHSLEDRIVKHMFREDKNLEVLTKKPVTAGDDENNPRARSAKMRFARRQKADNE